MMKLDLTLSNQAFLNKNSALASCKPRTQQKNFNIECEVVSACE